MTFRDLLQGALDKQKERDKHDRRDTAQAGDVLRALRRFEALRPDIREIFATGDNRPMG